MFRLSLSHDFSNGINILKAMLTIVRISQTAKQLVSRDAGIKDDIFTDVLKAARNAGMNGQKYI